MAWRWFARVCGVLVVTMSLGVGCAHGSGSHAHAEQPRLEVLGALEERGPAVASSATITILPTAASLALPTATDAVAPEPVIVAEALGTTAAPAPVTPAPPATAGEPAPTVGDLALASISYPWRDQLPGWEIVFLGPRSGLRGMTLPYEQRIEIYLRPGDREATVARVIAHELGHALDVAHLTGAQREQWRVARGAGPLTPWWPDEEASDFATLAGDFAEAFAVWQSQATSSSTVAGQPTAADLSLLQQLLP